MFNIDTKDQDIETKKRYLKRYKKNKIMVSRLESRRDALEERITSIKSPSFSDMPRGGQPVSVADLISDKLELEDRIERLQAKGRIIKREILSAIDTLEDPRLADVAEGFFIECKTLEELAESLSFSERYIRKLYMGAIIGVELPDIQNVE